MTSQITIPRETFEAMREALRHGIRWLNICDKPRECIPMHEALSAAKIVDHSEQHIDRVQPQAQGEAIDPRWAGIDFDKLNAEMRDMRDQIGRLQAHIDRTQQIKADTDGYALTA